MTSPNIGAPLARVDGHAKVTGQARYAAEFNQPGQAYAVVVEAGVGLGSVTRVDAATVERLPGVLRVISCLDAPRLRYLAHKGSIDPAFGERLHVLQDSAVRFYGQPVALVVAETLEQAEHGALRLRVEYRTMAPTTDLHAVQPRIPEAGRRPGARIAADTHRGDPERAIADAQVAVDASYRIAREHHNPMEPHATIAQWHGDQLILWSKSQFVVNEAAEIAAVFGLPAQNVKVMCPFIGGAFGTSLRTWPHVTLAALAAREVGRPVKLVLSRRQMFHGTGHRPATEQRISLGASSQGKLVGLVHEGLGETSRHEQFTEALTAVSNYLYSCPNVRTRYRLAPLDCGTPTFMRGPGEASGIFALECAMDELAVRLDIDPIALRMRNDTAIDEHLALPFSSRSLRQCFDLGAERFGWSGRNPRPRSMRDGRLLIGWGTAAAAHPVQFSPANARATLLADGSAEVEAAASDMGPGTTTSMTQVAADALGMPIGNVRFRLGRSDFPPTPSHGGSQTMASVGSAVAAAGAAALELLKQHAASSTDSPLYGLPSGEIEAVAGHVQRRGDASRREPFAAVVARVGHPVIGEGSAQRSAESIATYSFHSFAAVFAEVSVDPELGLVRVRRMVGTYAAGRIVNPRLARSQCIGGMTGGIGMALMERTLVDPRDGRPVNASLADYLVPVNLDVAELEAHFVDEIDTEVNPLGVKGVGEIALIGTAPAIANAVYHATGRRVRELPIRVEHLL